MSRTWKTLDSRYLLKRWWMNLREDRVVLPDGTELPEFHVVEYPDWTCVICLDETNRFVLVSQYRYAIRHLGLEFPSGAVDPGESQEGAARRELLEETGYVSDDWTYLGSCAPEPSKHTNRAHVYLATAARRVADPTPDHGEDLEVRLLGTSGLLQAIERGDLVHGIHLAALFLARNHLPEFGAT